MPRKRAITDQQKATLLEAIQAGASIEKAAHFARIALTTLEDERRRNRPFNKQVLYARNDFEVLALMDINRAGKTQWSARRWQLEKRFPEKYAKQYHEISGPDGAAIQVDWEARRRENHEIIADPDRSAAISDLLKAIAESDRAGGPATSETTAAKIADAEVRIFGPKR